MSVREQRRETAGAVEHPDPGTEWSTPLHRMAVAQFDQAAAVVGLDDESRVRLAQPRRALTVNFPVRMDDGDVRSFTGYRVQHTLTMGPTKGGIRYVPEASMGECAALAMWMTWKCALLRLPYGGAKGAVRCDPATLSVGELERLTRRFASDLIPVIGPDRDIPAPDLATGEREMAWFMDTYSQQVGYSVPEVVTGKPEAIGGIEARAAATGLGVVYAAEAVLEDLGRSMAGLRVVIQGFGNVGAVVAAAVEERGASVVGVADAACGLVDVGGLPVAQLRSWAQQHGTLDGCPVGDRVDRDTILEVPCDLLIPAALETQITAANAERIDCELVVEAANGPTTQEAEQILARRGIRVVPDILANAGGVSVSYFEWVQGLQRYAWETPDVHRRLRHLMRDATVRVLEAGRVGDLDWRTAAMTVAVERVAAAGRARGIYP